MVVKIFTNPVNYRLENCYKDESDSILIGVEQGAYYALRYGLDLDYVIGDFDSITETEKKYIDQTARLIKTHPQEKAETDLYLAIKAAIQLDPDEIIIYGGIGERLDHSYANILYLKLANITMTNDKQTMFMLDPGAYVIDNHRRYISFFAIEDIKSLTLSGFKYPLKNHDLNIDDTLCISNEGSGTLQFKTGLLLVIQSDL